jgi:hypothetical protein
MALGSVSQEPVFHATAVTNKGDFVRRDRMSWKRPASGLRQACSIWRCIGSLLFLILEADMDSRKEEWVWLSAKRERTKVHARYVQAYWLSP